LIALRKKIRAKNGAMTHETPAALSAMAAKSRLDPDPKLRPATTTSPGRTRSMNVGSAPSITCLEASASLSFRYFPGMIWSVEMSSPKTCARPRRITGAPAGP